MRELQRAGVTAGNLAVMVAQRLEKDGLTVNKDANEFVGLHVTAVHARKKTSAVALTLGLYQSVSLARDPAIKTITETWSGESVVLVPPELFSQAVAETVDELVDQFAGAFERLIPNRSGPA